MQWVNVGTMQLLSSPVKINPYLLHLTNGERDFGWFWKIYRHVLILWITGSILIQKADLSAVDSSGHYQPANGTYLLGLPLSIFILVVLVGLLVFTGTQLAFTETQSEQLALLYLTNISTVSIFWSLMTGIVYRARRWLTWILGTFPVFVWITCWWIVFGGHGTVGVEICFVSPLGNTYCYFDGPPDYGSLFEFFWFLSITLSAASGK